MDRGWIKLWRKTLDSEIWRMTPLHAKVFIWILLMADHKTGVWKTSIQQVAEGVEWEERGCPRTPNKRTILRVLDWLQDGDLVSRRSNGKGNAQYTELTVINWDTYQNTDMIKVTAKVTQSALKSAHITRSKPELKAESKEESKTVDLAVNPVPILTEMQAEGVVIEFAKDARNLKALMQGRQRAGVEDVPGEVRELWRHFRAGEVDAALKGRPHSFDVFRWNYDLLVERFGANGRSREDVPPVAQVLIPSKTPYTRWRSIKEYYPEATQDPDQGQPFTLSDEAVQATVNPFKLEYRKAPDGKGN